MFSQIAQVGEEGNEVVVLSNEISFTLIRFCLQSRQALVILASERRRDLGRSLVDAWRSEAGSRRRYG